MSDDRALPPTERCTVGPTEAQLAAIGRLPEDEPVTMLNLLRFREVADYSDAPDLAPSEPISGADAYGRYGEAALPHLGDAKAEIVYHGSCGPTIIGPRDEVWDSIVLVRYPSPAAFIGMVGTPEYQDLSRHRTAALADSRLVATSSG